MQNKQLVGKITHYYPHIGVAVVDLTGHLKIGDKILIEGRDSFEQNVGSMQIDMKPIKEAKPKQSIGLKVEQEVKGKALVYKI